MLSLLNKLNAYNPFSAYTLYDNSDVIQRYLDSIQNIENGKEQYIKDMIAVKRNAITNYANRLTGMSKYRLEIRDDRLVVTNTLNVNVKRASYWGLMAFGFWYVKLAVFCVLIPHMVSIVIGGLPVPLTGDTRVCDDLVFNIARQSVRIHDTIV